MLSRGMSLTVTESAEVILCPARDRQKVGATLQPMNWQILGLWQLCESLGWKSRATNGCSLL